MHERTTTTTRAWFGPGLFVALAAVAACSSYDPTLVNRPKPPDADSGVSGSGGTVVDAQTPDAELTDSMAAGGGGGGPTAGTSSDSGPIVEMDAAMPPVTECHPNPNTLDEVCPEICPEKCNGLDDDCDRAVDEDSAHDDCKSPHTEAFCRQPGKCLIGRCLDGYKDCNRDANDGCEVAPSDPDHCGECGNVCAITNGTATCLNGQCAIKKCNDGFDDCDDDPLACEQQTNTLADCGGCGLECKDVQNASPSCATGSCGVELCKSGYDDCDDAADNGCEERLNTVQHCGGCQQSCSFPGSVASCDSNTQVCFASSCKEGMGYRECDSNPFNGCESIKTEAHCGECGKACSTTALTDVATASCSTGSCEVTCKDGYGDCNEDPFDGCEVKLDTEQHCGSCDACPTANIDTACNAGVCEKVSCLGNFGDCDNDLANGCETPLDTLENCGGCEVPCTKISCNGGTCSSVDCSLTPGYGDCDEDGITCEINLKADLDNCGACGNKCEATSGVTLNGSIGCTALGCAAACDDGYADCDGNYKNGCEASLKSNAHCGGCGLGCAIANATTSCATGTCQIVDCTGENADCDGDGEDCETALNTPLDCGACDAVCNLDRAVEGCGGSQGARVCTVIGCEAEYHRDCDDTDANGCEIDTRSSGAHCGACNNSCAALPNTKTTSCMDSACVIGECNAGYGNCTPLAGCETALSTKDHCGACGNSCDAALPNTATTSCEPGTLTCKIGTCDPGYSDCDGVAANGCETSIYSVQNCGGCANLAQNQACEGLPNANTACAAGTCTVSSCASADHANCDGVVANGCERDVRPVGSGGLGPCLPAAGCTKRVSGNHEYYNCPGPLGWTAARDACRLQKNGDLAQLVDAAEKTFVATGLTAAYWIGSNDSTNEGLWVWSLNNMPYWKGTSTGSAQLGQYANWASGEPNNSGDCGQLYANGTWDDAGCTASLPFICEVSPDDCPSDPNKLHAGQCGCGSADTDADSDGFAVCNDACDADPAKLAVGVCGCGVVDVNTDGDSQYDCNELCDSDPNKLAPGTCGCGIADTDTDGDTFKDCIESCDNDINKQDPGVCGCGTADTNTDGDSKPDCMDGCPNDAGKIAAGQCGCGTADTDTDSDGTADCNDLCPNNAPKTAPGVCGCAVADTNTDGDSQPDCNEDCDGDPNKLVPGSCGCGVPDTNTDSDSQLDCNETCDSDPYKLAPGQCGCGNPDMDSDSDGTANCNDTCPFDSTNAAGCFKKTSSNVDPLQYSFATAPSWSCNAAGTTTIDSTAGTVTSTSCTLGTVAVTNNVAQTKPGLHYGKITGGWNTTTVNPANLAFDPLGPSISELTTEVASGSGERWVDGTTYLYTGEIYITSSGVASFMEHVDDNVYLKIDSTVVLNDANWGVASAGKFSGTQGWHTFELRLYDGTGGQGPSSAAPTGRPAFGYSPTDTGNSTDFTQYVWPRNVDASTSSLFRAPNGGPNVMVVRLKGLTLSNSHVLRLVGNKPVVILVAGNVTIDTSAVVDANASGSTPGAGGSQSCGSSTGGNGSGDSGDSTGGGGGGHGTNGGVGGTSSSHTVGAAGTTRGNTALAPIMGGCSGGNAGGCASTPGAGGGAVQISASGTLTVHATVRANGAIGANSCANDGGGAGGGSGGAILLEGSTIDAASSTITVHGGKGGTGDGSNAGGNGSTSSASNGSNGAAGGADGGGGGGGGYGRRKVTAVSTCTSCPGP